MLNPPRPGPPGVGPGPPTTRRSRPCRAPSLKSHRRSAASIPGRRFGQPQSERESPVILGVAGVAGAADGWLLWPVVGIHGILAVTLIVLSSESARPFGEWDRRVALL